MLKKMKKRNKLQNRRNCQPWKKLRNWKLKKVSVFGNQSFRKFEPAHEIMALFDLHKFILQMYMLVGLDV